MPIQRGERTPEDDFRIRILVVLERLGGVADTSMIQERLERKMRPFLRDVDYECLESGPVRWWCTASFAALQLRRDGYLRRDSPHGVWQLTRDGRAYLEEVRALFKVGERVA